MMRRYASSYSFSVSSNGRSALKPKKNLFGKLPKVLPKRIAARQQNANNELELPASGSIIPSSYQMPCLIEPVTIVFELSCGGPKRKLSSPCPQKTLILKTPLVSFRESIASS